MKTSVKNISDTKVELTVTLDAEQLATATKVATTKLAKDVKVPGFRKGKVPASVASKNIDPKALEEQTMDDAVSKAVAEAFTEQNIQVLDRPAVEIKKYVSGEMLEFTAEAEILPKVKLGDYKNLKAAPGKLSVETKDINEAIDRMRHGFAERKEVKRATKSGDETVIDFIGKREGVAFDGGTATDYSLTLGSNQFIPGFEEAIVGHKAGETFDIELTFPEDYHAADLKGANVTFTTTLKSVKEVQLPEVDDEFAKKAGPFKTVAELKADIKRELLAQKEREANEQLKDNLVQQLVAASDIPVPEVLIKDQMQSIERDFMQNLAYQGVNIEQYLETKGFADKEAWLQTEVHDAAVSRVKAGLALAELSKVEKVEATSDELATHIESYRSQYANNPEALKQLEEPEAQRDIANRLLTEKTVDLLMELNTKE